VYDPEADRYFWVGGSGGRHSGRDAQQQKVLDKKRRREEKKRQEKRRETEARRKEIQNRSRREEHGAGHDAGRGDAGGREGRRRGNVSLPALLLSRECGFCPCPGSVARYYECSSNLRLDEVRKARIQRSPKVHFNAVLNASHGFLWSRGASNRVFDDRLVVTNFASAASQAYPTKSPVIWTHCTESQCFYGFMGSGQEHGKVTVSPSTVSPLDATARYNAVKGTLWSAQYLDCGPFLSVGESDRASLLQVSNASLQNLHCRYYGSDVLAQASVGDRSLVLHGLRNGKVHLTDWREAKASVGVCKAGRSITELVSLPQDSHQFAILGYSQLPRLWDTRMLRPLVKYASSHLETLDGLRESFGSSLSPAATDMLDTLKLRGTRSLRISSDCTLLGCIKELKSLASSMSLNLIHLWSLKSGKTMTISMDLKGRSFKDFMFLPPNLSTQLNLPANSMFVVEQSKDCASEVPLEGSDTHVKLMQMSIN